MHKRLTKYLSLFLLLTFLFPIAEKQVHAFEHSTDKHCTASDKHFHEQEHHCDICDITLTDTGFPAAANYRFIASVHTFLFSLPYESVYHPGTFQNLPARAPPVA